MSHDWEVSPKDAVQIQNELQGKVLIESLSKPIQTIAGADVSLNMFEKEIYAGIIVLSYPDLEPLGYSVVKSRTDFPYIPGLLSFREVPALLECYKRLEIRPDVIMLDGQGIAHPRHLGIASHFGILAGVPTLGVAKNPLYGQFKRPTEVGEAQAITDPKSQETLGYAYKSKRNSNPLITSPGHKMNTEEALEITKNCLKGYRLPEPTRLAHNLVNTFRRGDDLQVYGKNKDRRASS